MALTGPELVRRFFAAYATGDLHTLRTAVLAPDAVWHVPGDHPLAGTHRGADAIVAYFRRLAECDFRAEVLFQGADDRHVVEVHRCRSDDGTLDTTWVLIFRINDGVDGIDGRRIAEIRKYPADQAQADAFFRRVYTA
ncbi:nuclear transport factor 2 family protein [Streptomyces sp. NPDC059009]|uniref:nuclear transport factor 2 family protein n=1 Tax=Streptomyces sp. NPDC059009 TaxID=3346694 RepID=UPI0036A44104